MDPMRARTSPQPPTIRPGERGGIPIILALILLSIMSAGALSMASSSIRELSITGSVSQGAKAAEAADAGLDWFIVWAHPFNAEPKLGGTGAAGLLSSALNGLKTTDFQAYSYPSGVTFIGNESDRSVRITSSEADYATNGMVFDNTAALMSQNQASGNRVIQKFDLVVRFLGFQPVALTGGGGQAAGGTNPNALSSQDLLWHISSTGVASVDTGGGYIPFRQRRDMIGIQSLSQ